MFGVECTGYVVILQAGGEICMEIYIMNYPRKASTNLVLNLPPQVTSNRARR